MVVIKLKYFEVGELGDFGKSGNPGPANYPASQPHIQSARELASQPASQPAS